MKKVIIILLSIILLISCNKSDFFDEINFEKFLLGGSGNYHNTEHTWYLDSLTINGVPFKLSIVQKQYNKTFLHNGMYTDSDGYSGNWDVLTPNELTISTKNNITGLFVTTKLKIIEINSIKFSYNLISSNGTKYDYFFKIKYE